ncbi:MAG TPA: copper ABC transporter ATP-binding protein [Saprospirales bacterium]|nr:copper ABC transporter ATP-binding protein [Saprospirales bacterium]HRQ28978.1 ABC transporter ATP-binding protein [Saprospiraceae bacterium]
MITIKNLIKNYGKLEVIKGMDLLIKSGGIFAILGPNGSGKTTLIKSILGMVIPNHGEITLDGSSVIQKHAYRKDIDYLPQIANFPNNLTVTELIKMVKDLRNKSTREDMLIRLFGLEDFLNKKLGNLSGGTRQKVNLVLAFMFDSSLVILDEPTSGLDPVSLIRLKRLILDEKARGKTVLITSHIMEFVEEMSDEIVFLLDGKIHFQGTTVELKQKTGKPDLEQAIAAILMDEDV